MCFYVVTHVQRVSKFQRYGGLCARLLCQNNVNLYLSMLVPLVLCVCAEKYVLEIF